jgi:hypothetical protein
MGESRRRQTIFEGQALRGETPIVDYRALMPKAPDYAPRERWGWGCFCVFDDADNVIDMVTVKLDGEKGFSTVLGELDYGKLQDATDMWRELKASGFMKRIVNFRLMH